MTPDEQIEDLEKQQQEAIDELNGLAAGRQAVVTDPDGSQTDVTDARKIQLADEINGLGEQIAKLRSAQGS